MDGTAPDPLALLLRSVPFFHALDRVDIARLLGSLEEVRAPAGELIAEEGAAGDALYLLEQGRIGLSVRGTDGDLSLREVVAPAHFGELGMLLARRTANSRAITDVIVWRLPRARFEALVRERPQIGLAVAASLAELLDARSREYIGAPAAPPLDRPVAVEPATGHRRTVRIAGALRAHRLLVLLQRLPHRPRDELLPARAALPRRSRWGPRCCSSRASSGSRSCTSSRPGSLSPRSSS